MPGAANRGALTLSQTATRGFSRLCLSWRLVRPLPGAGVTLLRGCWHHTSSRLEWQARECTKCLQLFSRLCTEQLLRVGQALKSSEKVAHALQGDELPESSWSLFSAWILGRGSGFCRWAGGGAGRGGAWPSNQYHTGLGSTRTGEGSDYLRTPALGSASASSWALWCRTLRTKQPQGLHLPEE